MNIAANNTPTLAQWIEDHGSNRQWLAERLGISYPSLRGLLLEGDPRYPIPAAVFDLRHPLADRIAELLGCTANDVRNFYLREVA